MADKYVCQLNEVGKQRAKTELGEIETDREAAVQSLREWVLAQGDWLKCPTDTQFLLGFLRHRKFSKRAAEERIIKFWQVRTENSQWFRDVDTNHQDMISYYKRGILQILPKRDIDGCSIVLGRLGLIDKNASKSDLTTLNRYLISQIDNELRHDMCQVCGVKVLQDFTGVTIEHILLLESLFRAFIPVIANSYPTRIRAVCYYNVGAVFDLLFTIIKQSLPTKIRDRITTHTSLQTVYDKIGMETLPIEYLPDDYTGPNGGPIDAIVADHSEKMQDREIRDYVLNLSSGKFNCDISKKPEDAVPTESFRSLNI